MTGGTCAKRGRRICVMPMAEPRAAMLRVRIIELQIVLAFKEPPSSATGLLFAAFPLLNRPHLKIATRHNFAGITSLGTYQAFMFRALSCVIARFLYFQVNVLCQKCGSLRSPDPASRPLRHPSKFYRDILYWPGTATFGYNWNSFQ